MRLYNINIELSKKNLQEIVYNLSKRICRRMYKLLKLLELFT